ncbi:MAG: transketolase, partial [Firmicutes bacterium]|nr:transketolase [Bacillota bacterium]
YFKVMRIRPDQPDWPGRDRFILSKGHAAPALYATLAARGFLLPDELLTFDQINSRLQGHPCMRTTPGVDMSSGSLGQGLSVGLGMALGSGLRGRQLHVWVLLGDGELQEGQVWEAAMAASKYKVANLTAIVDLNALQLAGSTEETMPLKPLGEKWQAFGWDVIAVNGHEFQEIIPALEQAKAGEKPTAILAATIKGKGVSFMENQVAWHSGGIDNQQLIQALKELN